MAQTQTHCEGNLLYLKKTDHMQDLNWKLTYLQTHIMVLSFWCGGFKCINIYLYSNKKITKILDTYNSTITLIKQIISLPGHPWQYETTI